NTRVPITEDTSSPETFKQIHTWLDTCKNDHPRCRAPLELPSLPTRLIYLDASRDSYLSIPVERSLQPRLVVTNGMKRSECRYIALSYRWPENFPVEAKSNRDNVSEQMRGLNTSKLPQIFNDVFQVAVGMGISYVWIDSLCIVQDDLEDWNREAALMVQVYQCAEITVAVAVPPTKPDLGLFRHGDPSDIPSVTLSGVRGPEEDGTGQDVVLMKPQKETWEAYGESPLRLRGWCFQEREISRRVIHYTETQVLWECRTIQASEGLPYGNRGLWTERVLDDELNDELVLTTWHGVVRDYSDRDLTEFTDKFPALSGLAAVIREYKPANCRYLAGLWEDNFLSDLGWVSWSRDGVSITNTRYPEYVAPTWSWASVAGPVLYSSKPYPPHSTKNYANDPKHMLKVLDIWVQTSTNDPFGAVEHAVLTCTAGLVPVLIGGKNGHDPDYHLETLHGVRMGSIFFDVDPQRYDGAEFDIVFCIHLGGPRLRDSQGRGLAVLPTGNKENEYRRVGIIPDLRRCTEFSDSEVKEITII
ncbi:heterokaryon incompatibility protein-domain-containing protein, partial [Diaporthe sp. PMI_573]